MAMVNIRIDDDLKELSDQVHKTLGITTTETLTRTLKYVTQHQQLPFMPEPQIYTAPQVAKRIWRSLQSARNSLLVIEAQARDGMSHLALKREYQHLADIRAALAEDLSWLHSAPTLPRSLDPVLLPFAQAQCQLALGDVALGGGVANDCTLSDDNLTALAAALAELDRIVITTGKMLGSILTLSPPTLPEEYYHDGHFGTVMTTPLPFPVGSVEATIVLRPDLKNLLAQPLSKGLSLPADLAGWHCGITKEGFSIMVPRTNPLPPAKSSSEEFSRLAGGKSNLEAGFCFIDGETRLTLLPGRGQHGDMLSPARIAEVISVYIDTKIREILPSVTSTR